MVKSFISVSNEYINIKTHIRNKTFFPYNIMFMLLYSLAVMSGCSHWKFNNITSYVYVVILLI